MQGSCQAGTPPWSLSHPVPVIIIIIIIIVIVIIFIIIIITIIIILTIENLYQHWRSLGSNSMAMEDPSADWKVLEAWMENFIQHIRASTLAIFVAHPNSYLLPRPPHICCLSWPVAGRKPKKTEGQNVKSNPKHMDFLHTSAPAAGDLSVCTEVGSTMVII